ncbi:MAG TPA: PfkB family carbohydrate kinase, partial [Fimbriimonadaceae bacterium]|nr:PfkB family carbohydrate kinase [Fimbriimonadaceae bacterium]
MTYAEILDAFTCQSALVIGDLMLDEYIFGRATRISPEAPVMVVRHQSTTRLPGGAANVARNILAFGADVHVVGVIGDDEGGRLLEGAMRDQGLRHSVLVRESGRSTTRKTRVLADHRHQVIRVDEEDDRGIGSGTEDQLM